jgi:hypothetical protein
MSSRECYLFIRWRGRSTDPNGAASALGLQRDHCVIVTKRSISSWGSPILDRYSGCPCRKLTFERIGGGARPRPARPRSDRWPGPRAGSARPSPRINASGPRCSIFDMLRADDEGAARQTARHGRGNPDGWIRSAVPHIHSAMASVLQSADREYPSLAAG